MCIFRWVFWPGIRPGDSICLLGPIRGRRRESCGNRSSIAFVSGASGGTSTALWTTRRRRCFTSCRAWPCARIRELTQRHPKPGAAHKGPPGLLHVRPTGYGTSVPLAHELSVERVVVLVTPTLSPQPPRRPTESRVQLSEKRLHGLRAHGL